MISFSLFVFTRKLFDIFNGEQTLGCKIKKLELFDV